MSVEDSDQSLTEVTDAKPPKKRSRIGYFPIALLMAAFALGVGLLVWGLIPSVADQQSSPPGNSVTPNRVADPTRGVVIETPGDGFGIVAGPATPWAIAGGPGELAATALPVAETAIAPVAAIGLLGPPADSLFRSAEVVSFFWAAPEPAVNGNRYTVYLIDGDERFTLGEVTGPNLGGSFQLPANIGQIAGEPGEYDWQVVLRDEATGNILAASEARRITIIGDN